jgi:hypothetical protein
VKKVDINVWVQLIGMLGVLGGLVFVGLEMRQSQRIAIGAQQQARAELRAQELLTPFQGNIDVAKVRFLEWEEMTDDQKLARGMLQLYRWNSLQNNFFQNNLGLLSADTWEQSLIFAKTRKSECHLRDFMPVNADPAFGAFLESLPDECAD